MEGAVVTILIWHLTHTRPFQFTLTYPFAVAFFLSYTFDFISRLADNTTRGYIPRGILIARRCRIKIDGFRPVCRLEMLSYKCTTEFPVRIGEVQFGILSAEEVRAMSTVQIKDTTIYYRGLPNPYGINDHRMGTVDRRLLCGTCCRDVKVRGA